MRYNLLGTTGLYVSELCLGAMTFGGESGMWKTIGQLGQQESLGLISAALDAGVNFIDTADVYSEGESERLVGGALKSLGRPREQIVVATKVRGRVGPGVNQVGLSRAHIMASIDGSLRRLGLDYVDLYQIHGFDPVTPIEETVRALDDVVRSGKVRYLGFSNLPAWVASHAITFAEQNNLARFQSAQVYYSIAGRDIQGARPRHFALEPARGRPVVGQVRSRKKGPGGRAPRILRFSASEHGAPAARAERAAQSRRRDGHFRRARRAGMAAHQALRHQHHHRRQAPGPTHR
jgi:aryl-alcohol dehydrogenase-like predicted oxidoreductase